MADRLLYGYYAASREDSLNFLRTFCIRATPRGFLYKKKFPLTLSHSFSLFLSLLIIACGKIMYSSSAITQTRSSLACVHVLVLTVCPFSSSLFSPRLEIYHIYSLLATCVMNPCIRKNSSLVNR